MFILHIRPTKLNDPLEASLAATVQALLERDARRLGLQVRMQLKEQAYFTQALGTAEEIELLARRLTNLGIAGCCLVRLPAPCWTPLGAELQRRGFQLELGDDDEIT